MLWHVLLGCCNDLSVLSAFSSWQCCCHGLSLCSLVNLGRLAYPQRDQPWHPGQALLLSGARATGTGETGETGETGDWEGE